MRHHVINFAGLAICLFIQISVLGQKSPEDGSIYSRFDKFIERERKLLYTDLLNDTTLIREIFLPSYEGPTIVDSLIKTINSYTKELDRRIRKRLTSQEYGNYISIKDSIGPYSGESLINAIIDRSHALGQDNWFFAIRDTVLKQRRPAPPTPIPLPNETAGQEHSGTSGSQENQHSSIKPPKTSSGQEVAVEKKDPPKTGGEVAPPAPNPIIIPPEPTPVWKRWWFALSGYLFLTLLWIFVQPCRSSFSLFFLWFSPKARKNIKVMVVPMLENINPAHLLKKTDSTDGFSIGYTTYFHAAQMRKDGTIVRYLDDTHQQIITAGNARLIRYDRREGISESNVISKFNEKEHNEYNILPQMIGRYEEASSFPDFFIISLDGPLLPQYYFALREAGFNIIQHIPYNNYLIYIQSKQTLEALKLDHRLYFIRHVTRYNISDKALYVSSYANKEFFITDITLHRAEDTERVTGLLQQRDIEVLMILQNCIRINLPNQKDTIVAIASMHYVQLMAETGEAVLANNHAQQIVGVSALQQQQVYNLDGAGEIIAISDTGVDDTHADLVDQLHHHSSSWGRTTNNDCSDPHGHGTHVAGIIAGNGYHSSGRYRGIAPGAKIFFQSLFTCTNELGGLPQDISKLFEESYNKDARIHNLSWVKKENEFYYTTDSEIIDQFVYDHPEMLIVVAAGNEADSSQTAGGTKQGYVGLRTISAPASAKNALTVGASRSDRRSGGFSQNRYSEKFKNHPYPPTGDELVSGDPESLAAFSGRGPVKVQYYVKPDMVAPGTDIVSTRSSKAPKENFDGKEEPDGNYAYLNGTSMAAPLVSGAAAIVREFYSRMFAWPTPGSALIKATLINGTRKLNGNDALSPTSTIPNYCQGFGILDLAHTLPSPDHPFNFFFHDGKIGSISKNESSSTHFFLIRLHQPSWLNACFCFIDKPAKGIQFYISLLIHHTNSNKSWAGNPDFQREERNLNEPDFTNNVEVIRLEKANAGLYSIKVVASTFLNEQVKYGLVITCGDKKSEAISGSLRTFRLMQT